MPETGRQWKQTPLAALHQPWLLNTDSELRRSLFRVIQKEAGPTLLKGVIVAAAACAAIPLILWSQTAGVSARDALVDRLLFEATHPIDLNAYSPDVRIELQRYLQRYAAYHST